MFCISVEKAFLIGHIHCTKLCQPCPFPLCLNQAFHFARFNSEWSEKRELFEKRPAFASQTFAGDTELEIELNHVPIAWDLEKGSFSVFGLDSAAFWTDPSLVRTLAPLAEEIGGDLFRLLISHSSCLGTDEDYHTMVSTLGENFPDGFFGLGESGRRRRVGNL